MSAPFRKTYDSSTHENALVDHNCRILLQFHFEEGASRTWLLKMIALRRGFR